jgi:hypothetical protein
MTALALDTPSPSPTARLIAFWLIAQLAALALAAGRIPLSAHFFEPAERMAVDELLVIQLLAAPLTFPLLLRDFYNSFVITITSIAMIFLANRLSRYVLPELLLKIAYVELCLAALAVWARFQRNLRSQLIGVCVAGGFTIFATGLWYFSREYQPDARDWLQYLSPLVATGRITHESGRIWAFAALPGIFLVAAIVALVSRRLAVRRP